LEALIIVDIQNDFLAGGSLAVPRGNEVIPVINAIQNEFDLIVATQDWHPQNHQSFAAEHPGKKEFDVIDLNGLPQVLWPRHCVQGSFGAEFSPELESNKVEAVFRKGMERGIDSYSGFYDNGKRKNTGLYGYLKDRGVTKVSVCGLAADFCVYFTANDALELGFDTTIIEAGSRPIHPGNWEQLKVDFQAKGGMLV